MGLAQAPEKHEVKAETAMAVPGVSASVRRPATVCSSRRLHVARGQSCGGSRRAGSISRRHTGGESMRANDFTIVAPNTKGQPCQTRRGGEPPEHQHRGPVRAIGHDVTVSSNHDGRSLPTRSRIGRGGTHRRNGPDDKKEIPGKCPGVSAVRPGFVNCRPPSAVATSIDCVIDPFSGRRERTLHDADQSCRRSGFRSAA